MTCKDCTFLHKDGHCGAWLTSEVRMLIPFANSRHMIEDICPQFRKREVLPNDKR